MDVPECNVCNEPLDEDEHQPRHLGCSHDACTACVKDLINNGAIECPMCRRVIKVNTVEDLPINHGVVQVLRLFKGFMRSENEQKERRETGNINEICRIHEQAASKRCVPCKLWICAQCQKFHTPDIGCIIQDYKVFMMSTKKDYKEKVEPTLLSIRKNVKSLSTELSELASEKKRIEERIEKMNEAVEDGTMTIDKLAEAAANVEKAFSSMELSESMNICNEWHQFAQIWCKKNIDYLPNLLEKIKSKEEVYTSMEINGKIKHSKVRFSNVNLFLHVFRIYGLNSIKTFNIFPYEEVQLWLPSIRDLVFLDLGICGEVKGRVIISLKQELTNYAKNIPLLFSGEEGHSLLDLQCWNGYSFNLAIDVSPITKKMTKFTRDYKAGYKVEKGYVLARWIGDKFNKICIYFGQDQPYDQDYEVFGHVVKGLDIVEFCSGYINQSDVTVIDCGIHNQSLKNL